MGEPPMSQVEPDPGARCVVGAIAVRRKISNTLRAFADITIKTPSFSLTIYDCTLHQADTGRRWCGLPGKPQVGPDGAVIVAGGKRQYVKVVEFGSRAEATRFSDAATAAALR